MAFHHSLVRSLLIVLIAWSDTCHGMATLTTSKSQSVAIPNRDSSTISTTTTTTIVETRNNHFWERRNVLQSTLISLCGGTSGILLFTNDPTAAAVVLALSPQEASTAYDSYASNYDSLDGGTASSLLGIDQARSELFRKARGNVLEIGAGTGLNLEKYDWSQIKSLTLLDISEGMLSKAQKRISSMSSSSSIIPIEKRNIISFVQADATTELGSKFGGSKTRPFDTVVDSFSLCTMGNEGAKHCLEQICQVVKSKQDGGQILLLENSRSSNPFFGLYQDASANAAADIGGKGCIYNQNVESMIESTKGGMKIEQQTLYAAGLFRSFQCSVVVAAAAATTTTTTA